MNTFRFAIMGAGNIANQFVNAVSLIENCEVCAVASKSIEKAQAFSAKHAIPAAYDSYEKMLEAEKPDCVYIATLPNTHCELTLLCLSHGTPVLCEKAMLQNSEEAQKVFSLSKAKNIFVMEAMWSRFLPAINRARAWLTENRIGQCVYADMAIGFIAPEGSDNRYRNKALGGGAAYDILVYAFEITRYLFPSPCRVENVSVVRGETGVDLTEQITLRYEDMLASLMCSFDAPIEDRMVIYRSEGKIIIPHPHFASEAYLYDKSGELTEHFRDTETRNGFTYEIREVIRCIGEGKTESSVVPHQATIECCELFDRVIRA